MFPAADDFMCCDASQATIFNGKITRAPSNAGSANANPVCLVIGGEDGLKAIAYIALTFLAHHLGDEARDPGVKPIKDFLTVSGANDFVWWERDDVLTTLPPNKFPFGHTIAITAAANGEIKAFVSLFGSLNFGVALGNAPNLPDSTVITYIDPKAEHPPNDIYVEKHDTVLFDLPKPSPLHAHLKKTIHEGLGEKTFRELVNKIEEWAFGNDLAATLVTLNKSREETEANRSKIVSDALAGQLWRIYRLIHYLSDDFSNKPRSKDPVERKHYDQVARLMEEIAKLTGDANAPLGDKGQWVLNTATKAFHADIMASLAKGEIDTEYLWDLFNAGKGLGIVGKIMFASVEDSLFGSTGA